MNSTFPVPSLYLPCTFLICPQGGPVNSTQTPVATTARRRSKSGYRPAALTPLARLWMSGATTPFLSILLPYRRRHIYFSLPSVNTCEDLAQLISSPSLRAGSPHISAPLRATFPAAGLSARRSMRPTPKSGDQSPVAVGWRPEGQTRQRRR